MCGIAGFTGKDKAVPYLMDCLGRLEYRGYDSAGIALCAGDDFEVVKKRGKLAELEKAVASFRERDFRCGIGHTRWATHGSPTEENAHPHLSRNKMFAIVHNGIIENYEKLREQLTAEAISFFSDTDSETVAQLLELYYEGDFATAVRKTISRLQGSFALAILCRDYPGKIFCVRKGSPLVLCFNETGGFVSSDVTSLVGYSKHIYRLDDGECALVSCDGAEFFDFSMKKIEKSAETLDISEKDARKQGYEHFMLKEIFEQKQTAERTVSKHIRGEEIVFEGTEGLFDNGKNFKRIVFVGCGSAYHVCLSAKYVTEALAGIYCSAEIASEWRYSSSPVDKDTLCVFISQSGETADTLGALEKAKKAGAVTLGIVNVPSSSLAVKSDYVIYTAAGTEIAVATTKAYTAQLLTVYLLALKMAKSDGESVSRLKRALQFLKTVPEGISAVLSSSAERAELLAKELYNSSQICFIGRNTDYAAALEAALKLKEVSYIPCEAYPSGELKHGTISLIQEGSVVVALMGNSDVLVKTLSNVREVKSRGARVIAVGDKSGFHDGVFTGEDFLIEVPCSESVFSALYEGIAMQFLAYFIAKNRKCDIDMPRNLAKSVTVE